MLDCRGMKFKSMSTYTKRLPKNLIYYWAIARFLIPFFVFSFPLFTTITADVLDRLDFLFAYNAGWSWKKYLIYDKIFDWWWYVFILLYSYGKYIFLLILVLFIYRTIGQIITIFTENSKLLILFPNILELYFWLFIFLRFITPQYEFILTGSFSLISLLICTVLAVLREYYIHINSKTLENFSFGKSWIKESRI